MAAVIENPVLVQAIYSFKGKNNDELNFKKGDVITITQKDDGGWWEGTLDGKTGWFPSNYVSEYRDSRRKVTTPEFPEEVAGQQKVYRSLILKDIIDSEKVHVTELDTFIKNILVPLETADILNKTEYSFVMSNIVEVVEQHKKLLSSLEESHNNASAEQRVGKIFLSAAAQLKTVLLKYCSNHPKAVCILEQHKDKLGPFVESHGGTAPGLIFLTAGLSRPFRRPERYAGSLQELERHMEESHPDRGDTQRSVHVYQDLCSACAAVRRQREQELEILSGSVRNWDGEEPSRLGELIQMGAVTVLYTSTSEVKERHLVLFTQALVFLSVTPCLSAFLYEGRLPVSGLVANSIEDGDSHSNAFEITGPMLDRLIVTCSSREDRQQWLSSFKKLARPAAPSTVPCHVTNVQPVTSTANPAPLSPQQVPLGPSAAAAAAESKSPPPVLRGGVLRPPAVNPPSLPNQFTSSSGSGGVTSAAANKAWTWSCLRPIPPLRPCLYMNRDERERNSNRSVKLSRKKELSQEDDVQILRVIEAYCMSAKTRHTVNSILLDSPQVLIAEEEKIIFEEASGSETVIEEKSLVDTVYALRDQVRELQASMNSVLRDIELLKAK